MAATVSCAMAMGRIGQSKPGWGLSRSVAPRCATGATWSPRRKSASPRRSCRSGRGGRRASMRCCRFSTCVGCRLATSRKPCAASRARTRQPVAGGDLAADGKMASGLRRLAEARPLGEAIRVRVGGRGLSAGPNGRSRRMHAGADRRNTRGQEGTRRLPDRGT